MLRWIAACLLVRHSPDTVVSASECCPAHTALPARRCAFRLIEGLGGASTRRFCSPASNRAAVPAGSGRGHRAAACGSSGPAPAGSCNLCSCAAAPGMQLVLRAVDAPLRQVPC